MKKEEKSWYRQLGAPGVEFRWELAAAAPKTFRLVVRSVADATLETTTLSPNVDGAAVTHFLVTAQQEFARQLEKRIRDGRRQRLDAIDAREAKARREMDEGNVPKPEGEGKGSLVEDDKVSASDDKQPAEAGATGARQGTQPGPKRGRRQPKNGADAHPAVPQAGG